VINLLRETQVQHGLTYVVISHDLAVIHYLADRIGVMYLGALVEVGPADRHLRGSGPSLHRGAG